MQITAASKTETNDSIRRVLSIVALTAGIPLLILLMLEGSLRIAGVGYSAELLVPCSVQGQPASCYNLYFAAPFFARGMIQMPRPYSIAARKPAHTYRIFVLGESAAMGDPDPAYSFTRYLEVMLRERYPSTNFEVVNTGSVAINSHVMVPIAKGLAKQQPDLFIIYSGNNEVVGPYGPGTALASSWAMQMPIIRASMFLRSTRTGQLLTKLGTPKKQWRGMELFLDKPVAADSPLMNYAYANFEENLRQTVQIAREGGAHVIISTVATNLRDCAPFGSQHRAGLSQETLNLWTALVQKGSDLENAGSYRDALSAYQSAAEIDSDYAELQFRIARSLWSMGEYQQANQHYARALDLDTLRFRADSRINEINRSVASASGVDLVDASAVFAAASEHGVAGSDLVYEHVHLTPEGNYLLARAMFQKIAAKLTADGAVASEPPSQAECERLLALTRHDRARLAAEMLQRIEKAPFTTQLNHSEQVEKLNAIAQQDFETPFDVATEYQWAIARQPNDRMLHYRFGSFLYPYNRSAAAEQLRMAQPWDGFPVFLPDGTQIQ